MSIKERDKEIGARLQEARRLAGLSVGQAAKLLGVAMLRVIGLEYGERSASPLELTRFAEIYDVRVDWLRGDRTENDLKPLSPAVVAKLATMPESERQTLITLLINMED